MREKYISWDEFFMGVAELASKRSKDPSTQNGACIVNPETNTIVSVGYNGLPRGLDDKGQNILADASVPLCPKRGLTYDYWEKPQKYEFSVHAEENAIYNANTSLKGTILYLYSEKGYYPCSTCARGIVQKQISEVVLHHEIKENTETYNWEYTKHMFKRAGIKIRVLNV